MTTPVPGWLAPHAGGERVVWSRDADRRWTPLAWTLLGIGVSVYFAGPWFLDVPGRWSWLSFVLPKGATPTLPGWIGITIGLLGFAGTIAQAHARRHFTAWAITERRLVRVPVLPVGAPASWPLAQVKIVDDERSGRRERTRVEVRSPAGKRLARFRVTTPAGGGFADALRAHLATGAASAVPASSW